MIVLNLTKFKLIALHLVAFKQISFHIFSQRKMTAVLSKLSLLSVATFLSMAALAQSPTNIIAQPLVKDPVLEAKVMEISKDLRCLVCQNETIAGSHADLAVDLRQQVKEQLEAGKTQSEIMQYMVDRYGDFILYNPRIKSSTLVLWGGPFVLMLLGFWALRAHVKQQNKLETLVVLDQQDLSQARAMLEAQAPFKKDIG